MSPEELFKAHKKLARITLYKTFPFPDMVARRKRLDKEDLLQYCYEGLWKACISWDESKSKFKTHAINNIRWFLIERVKRECNPMKLPVDYDWEEEQYKFVSLDNKTVVGYSNESGDDTSELYELVPSDTDIDDEMLYEFLLDNIREEATEKQLDVIRLRMKGYDYYEIGDKYGLNRETTRHWIMPFRAKIRKFKVAK